MPLTPLIDLNWLNECTSSLDFTASIFWHFLLQSILEDTWWSYLNTLLFPSHFHLLINYLVSANPEHVCPISHEEMAPLAASQLLTTQLSYSNGFWQTHLKHGTSNLTKSKNLFCSSLHLSQMLPQTQMFSSFPLKNLWVFFNDISIFFSIFSSNLVNIKMWHLLWVSGCNSCSPENLQSAYTKGRVVEKTLSLNNVKTATALFKLETKELIHLERKYSLRQQPVKHLNYILHNV